MPRFTSIDLRAKADAHAAVANALTALRSASIRCDDLTMAANYAAEAKHHERCAFYCETQANAWDEKSALVPA